MVLLPRAFAQPLATCIINFVGWTFACSALAPDTGIPQLDLTRVSMGDDSVGMTG